MRTRLDLDRRIARDQEREPTYLRRRALPRRPLASHARFQDLAAGLAPVSDEEVES